MISKQPNLTDQRIRSLDPGNMLDKTLELPDQLRTGMELGAAFLESHKLKAVRELDWIGLGGSAVVGDLLAALRLIPESLEGGFRVRRYPSSIGTAGLFYSYSGNTIETVKAFEETPPGKVWLCVSSGGRLRELADKTNVPHLPLPAGYPPRGAVGFGVGALTAVIDRLYEENGASAVPLEELAGDSQQYRVLDVESNPALTLAVRMVDRIPVIYSLDHRTASPLANRFRAQLAENAKLWSHGAELPEMAHNEVESFNSLSKLLPPPLVIFLGSWQQGERFADPRPAMRILLDDLRIEHLTLDPCELWPDTETVTASGLRTLLLLDAASVYLALLKAEDPLEIPRITNLKTLLTNS